MPRSVRISPVPIPPPAAEPRPVRRGSHAVAGLALLLLGVVAFAVHVVAAGAGDHSWDRHPTPPATVRIAQGQSYFVSTVDGPDVTSAGGLVCSYTPVGAQAQGLAVTPLTADSRATHAVASFVAPVSGEVTIACSGGTVGTRAVFVDDAEDHGADLGAWLLVLAIVCAVPGAGLLLAAGASRSLRAEVHRHTVTERTESDIATDQ